MPNQNQPLSKEKPLKRNIITVTGISCSGKTTLAAFANSNDTMFKEAIGTTTRPTRAGEVDGVDYDFVTVERFKQMEMDNELLESVCYSGNYYGRSIERMNKIYALGKTPLMVVEPIGANNIQKKCQELGLNAINVFINCPLEIAVQRWMDRYQYDVTKGLEPSSFYAERLVKTLTTEQTWNNACNYHFSLNYAANPEETAKQLSIIESKLDLDCSGTIIKTPARSNTSISVKELENEIISILQKHGSAKDVLRAYAKSKSNNLTNTGVSFSC